MVLPSPVLEVVEDLEDHVDEAGLEADRRLVDEQNFRFHDQRSGNLQEPALAARKHAGILVPAFLQPGVFIQHFVGGISRFGGGVHEVAAHEQVFLHRHVGKNRIVLENISDARVLEFVVGAGAGDVLAAYRDGAAGDVGEAVDRVQDRRLAGAVGADQAE